MSKILAGNLYQKPSKDKDEILKLIKTKFYPFDAVSFFEENSDLVVKYLQKSTHDLVISDEYEIPEEWQYKLQPAVLSEYGSKKRELNTLEILEWIKCSIDPIYYCKKYITITLVDGGVSKFDMFEYQEQMVNLFEANRFTISTLARQMGKTTVVAAYIMWTIHFHETKQCAVLANKADQAQEIMERIQQSYEEMPLFLKPAVRVYNKRSMTLWNKAKAFSGASSKSSIRGKSCVAGDTKITVRNKITGKIESLTMKELQNRLEQSSQNKQLMMQQIYLENNEYEVLTPDGWSDFDGLAINQEREVISLDEFDLVCTPCHLIMDEKSKEFVRADSLPHTEVDGTYDVYDLFDVKKKNQYYTNEVVSHNCSLIYWDEAAHTPNDIDFYESVYPTISSGKETKLILTSTPNGKRGVFYKLWSEPDNGFAKILAIWSDNPKRDEKWKNETIAATSPEQFAQEFCCEFRGSQHSLISTATMTELFHINPIRKTDSGLKIYKKVKNEHSYFIAVDTSRGIGGDYHAFSVIDITEKGAYEVVATFRNNTLSPLIYPTLIHNVAQEYNNAFVLVELNDIGEQVANNLYYDLEYENMLMVIIEKNRQTIGFSSSSRPGVRTTTSVKSIGCSNLKTLIEKRKLTLNDEVIIDELSNFVPKGNSFEADKGATDDLVMTLVLFAWATTQQYFIDMTDIDVRKQLLRDEDFLPDDLTPFGIIENDFGEYSGSESVDFQQNEFYH